MFKETVLRMLTKLGRRMAGFSKKVHKDLENIRKNQSELNNIITEIKKYTRGNEEQIR